MKLVRKMERGKYYLFYMSGSPHLNVLWTLKCTGNSDMYDITGGPGAYFELFRDYSTIKGPPMTKRDDENFVAEYVINCHTARVYELSHEEVIRVILPEII